MGQETWKRKHISRKRNVGAELFHQRSGPNKNVRGVISLNQRRGSGIVKGRMHKAKEQMRHYQ